MLSKLVVILYGICECGGTVYTADLKSAAARLEGSNPSSRTSFRIGSAKFFTFDF